MPSSSSRRHRQYRPAARSRHAISRWQQHPDLADMGHHARGFFAAAALGLARHIAGQTPSQTGIPTIGAAIPANRNIRAGQPTGDSRHHGGQSSRPAQRSRHRWTIPPNRRPQLVFGEGDLAQVFSCLTQLWHDCPGAGIAVCRFITMHQRPTDSRAEYAVDRARNSLTRLARKTTPNATSLRSAQDGIAEARSSSDPKGFLTAQTTYLEEQYLRFVHGLRAQIGLRELAKQLIANADNLQAAGSEGRQAYPRLMAADVLLQLSDITSANEQIALGFSLIGRTYPNPDMVSLGNLQDRAGMPSSS